MTSINTNTIQASVGGRRTQCLIDTGAAISCISRTFLQITNLSDSQLQPSDIPEIAGVGGERHKVLGVLDVPIKISKAQLRFKFYVMQDLQHPVILGIDFLEAHKVEIDLNRKVVFFDDKLVQTPMVQSHAGLGRLFQPTTIPANSQMNVLIAVSHRKLGEHVLLEPSPSLYNKNLAGAKCIVTVEKPKHTAVMSIINPTHEPVYLQYNSVVATVSDIDVNNLYPLNDEAEKKQSHDAYCSNINIPSGERTNISFDLSKSDLTDEQKATLTTFLEENKDLFSPSLKTLGKTDLYHHVMETEPEKGLSECHSIDSRPI